MRDIKFRFWDNLKKEFVLNKRFYLEKDQSFLQHELGITIQQYTGLKDRNTKEIYEGDIVKYIGEDDLIYHLPGSISIGEYFTHGKEFFHFGVRMKRIDMQDCYFGISLKDSMEYEILGNIFENPDLLK